MYILKASVESPHMLVASVTITAITNAVVLPVLKVLHRLRSVSVADRILRIGKFVRNSEYEMRSAVSVNNQP